MQALPPQARFRANPGYELVLFDQLADELKERFARLREDPELYGVLCSSDPGLSAKAVSRDVALLYLTLREPQPLPGYLERTLGPERDSTIAALVLDAVLEIESGGEFVSGPGAQSLLGADAPEPAGVTARLSLEALRYGQALAPAHARYVARQLYRYNRAPLTARLRRALAAEGAAERLLGIDAGGALKRELAGAWQTTGGKQQRAWYIWSRRDGGRAAGRLAFKLYVSPRPEWLPAALAETVAIAGKSGAACFKVGAGADGLLRADKLVLYFTAHEDLLASADTLADRLRGIPAQGVPFSAGLDDSGLLSWGSDPPRDVDPWQRPSWRGWVTDRLAAALRDARKGGADGREPWRFALSRLELDGVETSTWTPAPSIWSTG